MTNRRQLIDAVEVTDTGIHVARLKRIFDATSVNEFEKVLAYLISRQHYRIVVDLSQVEFVASAGWGAFTAEFRNVRKAGGDIRLAGMNPDVQDVFFLLELDSFINAYETADEAVESFEIEMRAMQVLPPAESAPAQNEHADEEAQALVEFVKPPQREEAEAMLEAEPVAFEVAEVFTPELHAPLTLSSGKAQPPAPDYERLTPTVDEEEGWEVADETSESHELVPYSTEEAFAAFDAEIAFDAEVEEIEEDAPVVERKPAVTVRPKAEAQPATPKTPKTPAARTAAEEWPEAHAEENVASEDFELQDIHDPWILEEIDTLPEEDELEGSSWSEEFDEEPPTPKAKSGNGATAPESTRAPVKNTAPVRATRSEKQSAPATENVLSAAASATTSLADRVKAASKAQAPSAAKELSEEEHVNLVRQIVSEHPHYGPAMIQDFFETRLDPPMPVSRSTIYRWLRLAGLNTREQRLAFAGKADV